MQNYVSIHECQTGPIQRWLEVHGQAALLLRYDVPTYYVSEGTPGCRAPDGAPGRHGVPRPSPFRRFSLHAA